MLCEHISDSGIVHTDKVVLAAARRRHKIAVEKNHRYFNRFEELQYVAIHLFAVADELERLEEYA